MTNAEQKRVFANNLTHYININGKQQNEVAKAIGEKPTRQSTHQRLFFYSLVSLYFTMA